MDAHSKGLNLANFNGLEILCPKEVYIYILGVFYIDSLTPWNYSLANMEVKWNVEGCQIAIFVKMEGTIITEEF